MSLCRTAVAIDVALLLDLLLRRCLLVVPLRPDAHTAAATWTRPARGARRWSCTTRTSDGSVAGEELEKAPGLKAALPHLDTNGDKAVTADEVAALVDMWQRSQLGVMMFDSRSRSTAIHCPARS